MLYDLDTIKKKLLSISGISPLTYNDEHLLRASFPNDETQYMYSFLYLLRASHNDDGSLGYKFIDNDITAVIGYRNTMLYITPIYDATQGQKLQLLCRELFSKANCRILIKKFSQKKYPKLNIKETVTKREFEDDACPETLIELKKLFINQEGELNIKASKLLKMIRRFERSRIQYEILHDFSSISLPKIEEFLKKDNKKYTNYYPILSYLYATKTNAFRTIIYIYDWTVAGLYIADQLSPTKVGLYCAVNAKEIKGSTEWMDYYFFKYLFSDGIQQVYLGGSENEGVNYYIKKLLPSNTSYTVTAAEYDPTDS